MNPKTGDSMISVVDVCRRPSPTPPEDGALFLFSSVVSGFPGKSLMLGLFNAPGVDFVCETVPEGNFGHQFLQLVHVDEMVQYVIKATRR